MSEVEEYRIKIEAMQERLKASGSDGDDEVRELKERLGAVRDSLRHKQETIDGQKADIATLREESAQLSDMLGQALAALEAQNQGGIKEIVQSIDSEFAGLLAADEGQPEEAEADEDGDRREPANAETDSDEAEIQDASSEGPKWDPENESAPALQRIMGRKKR